MNSQFEEVSHPDIISAHVKSLTGLDQGKSEAFGISRFASLTTWRETWIADKEFKIVLDQTDFGHTVGEAELETQAALSDKDEAPKLMLAMDNKIAKFIQCYTWAFSDGKPTGKLSAYFEYKAQEGS